MLAQQLFDQCSLVCGGVIQQYNHWAAQMLQQFAQIQTDLILPDVVIEEQIVEPQVAPLRAYRNSGKDGDLVTSSLAVAMNGSFALRRPGSDHVRNQQETRFIGKDDVGTQPCGVFFIRAHSFCFQRSIWSSSRSRARLSGFCGFQPRLCSKRPIWSGW